MLTADGQSPPLTLRPMMACHQSSTATQSMNVHQSSSVLAYQHSSQQQSFGVGGGACQQALDVSDPNGNAMTLLRNVESVYFASMTSEDEKNKMLREKIHAEEQARKLNADNKQLLQQLTQEKARRTADTALTHELGKNELLMKDILVKQQEVKKIHERDFKMVKELRHHSSAHRAVLSALQQEVHTLRAKQKDRKILKDHKAQLWTKAKELKDKLGAAEKRAASTQARLEGEASAARDALREELAAKDSASQKQLAELQTAHDAQAKADKAKGDAQQEAVLTVLRDEMAAAESALTEQLAGRKKDSAAAVTLAKDLRRQHDDEKSRLLEAAEGAREAHESLVKEHDALKATYDAASAALSKLQAEHAATVKAKAEEAAGHAQAVGALEAAHKAKVASLEGELSAAQKGGTSASAEAEQHRSALEASEKALEEAKTTADALQRENTEKAMRSMGEVEQMKKKEQTLSKEVKEAQRQRDEMKKKVEGLEKAAEEHTEVVSERDTLASRVRELEAAAQASEGELAMTQELRDKVKTLESQLEEALNAPPKSPLGGLNPLDMMEEGMIYEEEENTLPPEDVLSSSVVSAAPPPKVVEPLPATTTGPQMMPTLHGGNRRRSGSGSASKLRTVITDAPLSSLAAAAPPSSLSERALAAERSEPAPPKQAAPPKQPKKSIEPTPAPAPAPAAAKKGLVASMGRTDPPPKPKTFSARTPSSAQASTTAGPKSMVSQMKTAVSAMKEGKTTAPGPSASKRKSTSKSPPAGRAEPKKTTKPTPKAPKPAKEYDIFEFDG